MKAGRLLSILGIIAIVYGIISGFSFHFNFHDGDFSYSNAYQFKLGTVIIGLILLYLGKRLKEE